MTTNAHFPPMQSPASWSAIAEGYASEVNVYSVPYAEEALRIVAPAATDHILDLAAGSGVLAISAAARAERVVAVDFAPGMVEQIRERLKREAIANVSAEVMDAQSLDFPDATFDAVYCLFAFMFIPDRARAFRELFRVLRPDGRALVATWAPIERRPLMRLAFEAFAEAWPDMPRPAKGDLQTPEECVKEMSEAGFRDVTVHVFTASIHVDSAERYLAVIERGGPMLTVVKAKLGDAWEAQRGKLVDALRRRIPKDGLDLAAEALMTVGTR